MSDPSSSNMEARLLSAEREVYRLYHQIVEMSTWRARGLEEGLAMAWTGGNRRCISTISGTIVGCLGDPLPAGTIQFVDHFTLEDYGTFTADEDGEYIAEFRTSPGGGGVDIYVGGPGDRWDTTPSSINAGFSRCGSTTFNRDALPGTDHVCEGDCNFPIAKVLDCDDAAVPGTFAVTYGGVSWTGTHGGRTYTLIWTGAAWRSTISGIGFVNATSHACPDEGGTKFSANFNHGGGHLVDYTEP